MIRLRIRTAAALALAGFSFAGCSRLPERVESLENARESVTRVEREPLAGRVAGEELAAAREALAAADEAYEEGEPLPLVEQPVDSSHL